MKKIIINEHSDECQESNNSNNFFNSHLFCHLNPARLILYFEGDYYYFEYFKCKYSSNEIDMAELILKELNKKTNKTKYYSEVRRSRDIKEIMNENKRGGIKNEIKAISFIYANICREFCITTKSTLTNELEYNESLQEKSQTARNELEKMELNYLVPIIDDLEFCNRLNFTDYEIIKSIDKLTQLITNKTKKHENKN
jgi:hypothetical protein